MLSAHLTRERVALAGAVAGFAASATAIVTCGGDAVSYCMPGMSPVNGVCATPDAGGVDAQTDGTAPTEASADGSPNRFEASSSGDEFGDVVTDVGIGRDAQGDSEPDACPTGRGPHMTAAPGIPSGSYCIDETEVTEGQYADFLGNTGSPELPAACMGKTSFAPGSTGACSGHAFDPAGHAEYPVACVDWCDAYAFCAWAHKTLCDPLTVLNACSENGKQQWPTGNTPPQLTTCNLGTDAGLWPVTSSPCRGTDAPWSGVSDLIGNAWELVDDGCGLGSSCSGFGGSYERDWYGTCLSPSKQVAVPQPNVGFRCCL